MYTVTIKLLSFLLLLLLLNKNKRMNASRVSFYITLTHSISPRLDRVIARYGPRRPRATHTHTHKLTPPLSSRDFRCPPGFYADATPIRPRPTSITTTDAISLLRAVRTVVVGPKRDRALGRRRRSGDKWNVSSSAAAAVVEGCAGNGRGAISFWTVGKVTFRVGGSAKAPTSGAWQNGETRSRRRDPFRTD